MRSWSGDEYRKGMASHHLRDQLNGYRSLGQALHPIMDSTSPAHQDFQIWYLTNPSQIEQHGDLPESIEGLNSLTPGLLDKTKDFINQTMRTGQCPCEFQ